MKEKRFKFILSIFALCAVYLVFVQMGICFIKGEEYTKAAVMQRKTSFVIKTYRGRFLDKNMIPLVESSIASCKIDKNGEINTKNGVSIGSMTMRYGPDSLARHLIGYVDKDNIGVSGLEKAFEKDLKSKSIREINAVKSADGRVIESMGMSLKEDNDISNNVLLTIDSNIQKIAEDVMESNLVHGACVILDTKTSDVLAMASTPSYDQNDVASCLNSENGELINRCVASYNAGSIFKIITLSAALERLTTRSSYECNGFLNLGTHTFNCHKSEGHGVTNYTEAFSKSCNCAFYTMGLDLGSDAILNAAKSFGLGKKAVSGGFLDESAGNISNSKEQSYLDAVNISIGQGEILLTPIQAANIACIVANNGLKRKINVAKAVVDKSGSVIKNLYEKGEERVLSESTAEIMKTAMCSAVSDGTGKAAESEIARIAGKTGTAETGWLKNGRNLVHGWFCGYFPYDSPRYAMAVLADDGGTGSLSAAPVFKEIAEKIIKIYPVG